jgi:hypothetical protein
MDLRSPISLELVDHLRRVPGMPPIAVISELYLDGGTDLVLQVGDLMVSCIQGPADLTLAVRSQGDPEWSAVPFLNAFLEEQNDPGAIDRLFNNKELIAWLAARFSDVYELFRDPKAADRKAKFLAYQKHAHKERLQADRERLKSLSPSEWRSMGPGSVRR